MSSERMRKTSNERMKKLAGLLAGLLDEHEDFKRFMIDNGDFIKDLLKDPTKTEVSVKIMDKYKSHPLEDFCRNRLFLGSTGAHVIRALMIDGGERSDRIIDRISKYVHVFLMEEANKKGDNHGSS